MHACLIVLKPLYGTICSAREKRCSFAQSRRQKGKKRLKRDDEAMRVARVRARLMLIDVLGSENTFNVWCNYGMFPTRAKRNQSRPEAMSARTYPLVDPTATAIPQFMDDGAPLVHNNCIL